MKESLNSDHIPYYFISGKARLDLAINSLLGIVEGISIDREINDKEIYFFNAWLDDHREFNNFHPYNELIPVVELAIQDRYFDEEERADISWLCEKFRSNRYYDVITSDLQRLHAILGSIAADAVITEKEIYNLSAWIADHEHLKRCWPYDEIDGIITSVLADGKIDKKEHDAILSFFSEFIELYDDCTITQPIVSIDKQLVGVCAVNPEITFKDSVFCFTGASSKYKREEFHNIVKSFGGKVSKSVTLELDYLVVGADGNPCWAYSCYGRKIEKAVELRKQGCRVLLIHEIDFHDAIADMK